MSKVGHDGLAQGQRAGHRRVSGLVGFDGLAAGSADVRGDVGATLLPVSAARAVRSEALAASNGEQLLDLRRVGSPTILVPLVLCVFEDVTLPEPARAVREILMGLATRLRPQAGIQLAPH